jgi:hypothetical protein
VPLQVLASVNSPLTLKVSVQPPGIAALLLKTPSGQVVAAPVMVLGLEGDEAIVAPSPVKMKALMLTATSPWQQV